MNETKTCSGSAGKKRLLSILLALSMIISMIPLTSFTTFAAGLPGARSETSLNGDVFLGGNYIEVGVSRHGSFGTEDRPTDSSFHPYGSAGLGLRSDGDGWDVGSPSNTGDFFLPGRPEERWTIHYTNASGTQRRIEVCDLNNGYYSADWKTEPTVTDTSNIAANMLGATVTAVTIDNIKVTLTYSFGVDDKFFTTKVDIQNIGTEQVTGLRFMRSFDPDQDYETKGTYHTHNKVVCNPLSTDSLTEGGDNNFAMVVAKGQISKEAFFFIAFDERARGTILPGLISNNGAYGTDYFENAMWRDNTSLPTAAGEAEIAGPSSNNADGYTTVDKAIALVFNIGNISSGASDSLTFYSSLDPNAMDSLSNIKKAANGKVNYINETIIGMEAGKQYTLTFSDASGVPVTVTVTADTTGAVPLVGTGSTESGTLDYDLLGKTVTITPVVAGDEVAVAQDVDIAARPDAPDAPVVPSTATKPESVTTDQVDTNTDSITITAPVSGQEYSIDNGATWKKYTGTETITFTGLTPNTQYTISTRIFATEDAPASAVALTTTPVRTQVMLKNISITVKAYSGTYDGLSHGITVSVPGIPDADIAYSLTESGNYSPTNPTFSDVCSQTVFYRVSKDGYYPTYGSSTVTISQASPLIIAFGEPISYGKKLADSQLSASAIWNSEELEGEFSWVDGSTIYPAVSDSQSTLYTVRFTPTDTVNFKTIEKKIKITVNKATQEEPNDIESVNETYLNQANGQILHVNDKMEYRRSGESFVSVPTGATVLSNLTAGNYQVRYKGDDNHNPSPVRPVTIAAGKKVEITLPDNQVGYSLTASEKAVSWNQEVTIQFEVKDGYSTTEIAAVKLNGTALELTDGKATVAMKADAVLTVSGVKDITAPTGDITFNSNSVKQLINTISFGLFFNDSVDVEITAEDAGSGIDTIQYIRSTSVMSEEAVKTSTAWKTYETLSESPSDAEKFIYYVKLTDKDGNVTYIASNGATFDTTVPAITGVANNAIYYTTQKATASDINLQDISLNGSSTENPVMLAGNKNATYVIKVTDKAGNETTYTVTMMAISNLSIPIDSITVENVKSSDKSKIEEVKSAVNGVDIANATNAEKDALKVITDKCDTLLAKISNTAAEDKRITDGINAYDLATVKSSDKASIEQIITDIDTLVSTDNLTADEKEILAAVKNTANTLLTKISDTAAEIKRITDAVNAYDLATVKSTDKASIEQIITDIDTLVATENLTTNEANALSTVKTNANALLNKIADASDASVKQEIKDAETINKDNVKATDKDTLAKAKASLEATIKDYEGNYIETELATLKAELATYNAALSAIENSEKVVASITALPEAQKVKASDKDAINAAKAAYDALTENEKAMVSTGYAEKLNAAVKAHADLGKGGNSPQTGDTSNMALWFTLLFVSGGALSVFGISKNRKKNSAK